MGVYVWGQEHCIRENSTVCFQRLKGQVLKAFSNGPEAYPPSPCALQKSPSGQFRDNRNKIWPNMEDALHKLSIAKTVLRKKVLKEHFIYYRFYRQLDNQKVTKASYFRCTLRKSCTWECDQAIFCFKLLILELTRPLEIQKNGDLPLYDTLTSRWHCYPHIVLAVSHVSCTKKPEGE